MKYCIPLHSRRWYSMGKIEWNNKKKLIEDAQWHMDWLSKKAIEKYLILNQ